MTEQVRTIIHLAARRVRLMNAALIYNAHSAGHHTGHFVNDGQVLQHHLDDYIFPDEVYKPTEINYPYPFPSTFDHPETIARLETVYKAFENWGLLERFKVVAATPATDSELLTTHPTSYLEYLRNLCQHQPGAFAAEATPIATHSYEAARLSAGAALTAGRLVLSGATQRAFALTRPPGHHAATQQAGGFCLLNNAAILANYALTQPGIKRILLLDWDIHHGNGTQEIFWHDARVLFNSFHQFGPGIYPGSGAVTEIGAGVGRGYTVNVPLPTDCPDPLYQAVFEQVTTTLSAQYEPDLIIVSAGQDGHFGDLHHLYLWEENSGLGLTAQHYYNLTRHVLKLADNYCGGRCVFIQEGGYNLTNLANSVLNIGAALLDLPIMVQEQIPSSFLHLSLPTAEAIIAPIQANLQEFWNFNL